MPFQKKTAEDRANTATLREAATLLGISRVAIWRAVVRKKLSRVTRRTVYVDLAEVQEYFSRPKYPKSQEIYDYSETHGCQAAAKAFKIKLESVYCARRRIVAKRQGILTS